MKVSTTILAFETVNHLSIKLPELALTVLFIQLALANISDRNRSLKIQHSATSVWLPDAHNKIIFN